MTKLMRYDESISLCGFTFGCQSACFAAMKKAGDGANSSMSDLKAQQ